MPVSCYSSLFPGAIFLSRFQIVLDVEYILLVLVAICSVCLVVASVPPSVVAEDFLSVVHLVLVAPKMLEMMMMLLFQQPRDPRMLPKD